MRTRTLLLLLLACSPVFAQERWRASVLRVEHGFGAALAYAPNASWDVEAAVSHRGYEQPVTTFSNGGIPLTVIEHHSVQPIDVFVTRHFAMGDRLGLFVHAGGRYVELPGNRPRTVFNNGLPATFFGGTLRRTSAQAGGGVRLRLTPRTALRAEVTRLMRSGDLVLDPLTRVAAGVSWHF